MPGEAMQVAYFFEMLFNLLFGWFAFLLDVVPELTVNATSIIVAALALGCFTLVLHKSARSWIRRKDSEADSSLRRWRWRSTLAVVVGLFVVFSAGTAMVGLTHQVIWVAGADPAQTYTKQQTIASSHFAYDDEGYPIYQTPEPIASTLSNVPSKSPNGLVFDNSGRAMHSWLTRMAPFIPISSEGVHWNLPWRHPAHRRIFSYPIDLFQNPAIPYALQTDDGYGATHFATNGQVLEVGPVRRFSDITDSKNNTILAGEVNSGFRAWGDPVSWRDPSKGIAPTERTFSGPKSSDATMFLMVDGSVRTVNNRTDSAVLKALATPRAGD